MFSMPWLARLAWPFRCWRWSSAWAASTSTNSSSASPKLAELDAAVLADELPLTAYLDHGFNAYLESQQRQQ
jgi:hypothetical protein